MYIILGLAGKMPLDDVALSYWCGKNVLIDAKDRLQLFRTNSITERMLIISKSLDYVRYNFKLIAVFFLKKFIRLLI